MLFVSSAGSWPKSSKPTQAGEVARRAPAACSCAKN